MDLLLTTLLSMKAAHATRVADFDMTGCSQAWEVDQSFCLIGDLDSIRLSHDDM